MVNLLICLSVGAVADLHADQDLVGLFIRLSPAGLRERRAAGSWP